MHQKKQSAINEINEELRNENQNKINRRNQKVRKVTYIKYP